MWVEASPENLRPTYAEVNLSRLAGNLSAIRRQVAPAKVMPVVKANAYGHGLLSVSRYLLAHGADMLGVAILDEGLLLRQAGIQAPVHVLGGILPEQIPAYLQNDLILTATSIENLRQIESVSQKLGIQARVHLKIDTGMGRLGVPYYEAEPFLAASLECSHLTVEGIFSHFANSDAADLASARLQIERFEQVLAFYYRRGLPAPLRHMANSGGILQLPESHYDIVRPGIMLYGVYPSKEVARSVSVRPALTWKTHAVHSKILRPFHPVSYGSTWQADHPVRLLTLPVGYGDGYFRLLSNKAPVLVNGRKYPLVGRVCMDQILVNLESDRAETGVEAILIGESGQESITCDDLADLVGTIPYEILTNINNRVPRLYVERED